MAAWRIGAAGMENEVSPEMKEGILVGIILGFLPGAGILLSLAIDMLLNLLGRLRYCTFFNSHDLGVDRCDFIRHSLGDFYDAAGDLIVKRFDAHRRISGKTSVYTIVKPLVKFQNFPSDKIRKGLGENG